MFPRSMQIIVALVALLTGALGIRGLIGRSGILDHSPSVAAASSSIDIQLEDMTAQDFRSLRATECYALASITNSTQHRINDLSFRVGDNEFRFNGVDAGKRLDRWNVGSIDLTNVNSSCADQALYILNNIEHASPWACVADGLSQAQCRSLVRIATRIGPATIARIAHDELKMGKRNMARIMEEIPREIAFIIDNVDNTKNRARAGADELTNDVVVLNATTTRYYVGDGSQAGWHVAPYQTCERISLLNKGGLAAFHAPMTQRYDAYRDIPSGYAWYARPTAGPAWYGQVRIADIAPAEFVAKCDLRTGIAELVLPPAHSDGTPKVLK